MSPQMGAPAPSPAPVPPAAPFQDLSAELSDAWQLIDLAARVIKKGLITGGLYQQPEALAAIRAVEGDLDKIISTYSKQGATMGPTPASGPAVSDSVEPSSSPEMPQ